MTGLEELVDWREFAACRGKATFVFFPETGTGSRAKRICAGCPVREVCLTCAVARREEHGVWGGAGGDLLRGLERAYRHRTHEPLRPWFECQCRWCLALRRHFAALDGEAGEVVDRNGPGATHGRRVTYNRGCRCPACRFSATAEGQALDRAGIDTAVWWAAHGDDSGSRFEIAQAVRERTSRGSAA